MDLSFYDLKREPFNVTPDPSFLSLNKATREALAVITYGVEHKKGFILITGEVGVGKTTVLRAYLDSADKAEMKTVYIFNSNITFKELLKTIYQELGLAVGKDDVFEMVNKLNRLLIREYRLGHKLAIIIDEAQNMPKETLENLRTLSNLETSTDKLLQVVLVGQPEIEEILGLRELRQLNQRIAVRFKIPPLTEKEALAYIKDRLAKAATKNSRIFTRGALKLIVDKSGGIPRVINLLCSSSLVTGLGYRIKPVNTKVVNEVIMDFEGAHARPTGQRRSFAPATIFLAAICISGFTPSGNLLPERENFLPSQAHTAAANEMNNDNGQVYPMPNGRRLNGAKPQEVDISKTEKKQLPAVRFLKRGDNLYILAKDIYGFFNQELMGLIKRNNPEIIDMNKLKEGEKIIFPELDDALIPKGR